jgi:hypothetical protein
VIALIIGLGLYLAAGFVVAWRAQMRWMADDADELGDFLFITFAAAFIAVMQSPVAIPWRLLQTATRDADFPALARRLAGEEPGAKLDRLRRERDERDRRIRELEQELDL